MNTHVWFSLVFCFTTWPFIGNICLPYFISFVGEIAQIQIDNSIRCFFINLINCIIYSSSVDNIIGGWDMKTTLYYNWKYKIEKKNVFEEYMSIFLKLITIN